MWRSICVSFFYMSINTSNSITGMLVLLVLVAFCEFVQELLIFVYLKKQGKQLDREHTKTQFKDHQNTLAARRARNQLHKKIRALKATTAETDNFQQQKNLHIDAYRDANPDVDFTDPHAQDGVTPYENLDLEPKDS